MTFDPLPWMAAAFAEYVERQQTILRAAPRPYLYESVPCDPEWLASRAEFAKRWAALRAEGFEKGWLEEEPCYECAGEVMVTTNTTTAVRRPNPDYVPPEPLPPGATITIPVIR